MAFLAAMSHQLRTARGGLPNKFEASSMDLTGINNIMGKGQTPYMSDFKLGIKVEDIDANKLEKVLEMGKQTHPRQVTHLIELLVNLVKHTTDNNEENNSEEEEEEEEMQTEKNNQNSKLRNPAQQKLSSQKQFQEDQKDSNDNINSNNQFDNNDSDDMKKLQHLKIGNKTLGEHFENEITRDKILSTLESEDHKDQIKTLITENDDCGALFKDNKYMSLLNSSEVEKGMIELGIISPKEFLEQKDKNSIPKNQFERSMNDGSTKENYDMMSSRVSREKMIDDAGMGQTDSIDPEKIQKKKKIKKTNDPRADNLKNMKNVLNKITQQDKELTATKNTLNSNKDRIKPINFDNVPEKRSSGMSNQLESSSVLFSNRNSEAIRLDNIHNSVENQNFGTSYIIESIDFDNSYAKIEKLPYTKKVNFVIQYLIWLFIENLVFIIGLFLCVAINWIFYNEVSGPRDDEHIFNTYGKTFYIGSWSIVAISYLIGCAVWINNRFQYNRRMTYLAIASKFSLKCCLCFLLGIFFIIHSNSKQA